MADMKGEGFIRIDKVRRPFPEAGHLVGKTNTQTITLYVINNYRNLGDGAFPTARGVLAGVTQEGELGVYLAEGTAWAKIRRMFWASAGLLRRDEARGCSWKASGPMLCNCSAGRHFPKYVPRSNNPTRCSEVKFHPVV